MSMSQTPSFRPPRLLFVLCIPPRLCWSPRLEPNLARPEAIEPTGSRRDTRLLIARTEPSHIAVMRKLPCNDCSRTGLQSTGWGWGWGWNINV